MERPIGEEFEVKLRIKVAESGRTCKGCIFDSSELCGQTDLLGACDYLTRNDGKNIHFEIVFCESV